jgi:hypothetical protein
MEQQEHENLVPASEVEPDASEQQQPVNKKDEASAHRYTVTQEKLAANRKNAQSSTGPRTAAGKAAIRLNALKHGILAKEIFRSGKVLGESRKDFESLLSGLCEAFEPIGKAEELAVEEIAVTYVRRARALRAELGEIEREELESEEIEEAHCFSLAGKSPAALDELRNIRAIGDNLPPPWVLEHTMRYEAMLDRQMMRAVQWFEMLQQRRRALEQQPQESEPPGSEMPKLQNKPKSAEVEALRQLGGCPLQSP